MCNSKKNYSEGKLLKILPASGASANHLDTDALRLVNISSPRELDEYVILQSSLYEAIFGKKKIKTSNSKKRLSIVKICHEGKCIHRAYLSVSANGFDKNYVALTPNSIYELSKDNVIEALSNVCISKGSRWTFYWNNPVSAVRMSFRIGVIGIIVSALFGIVSIILTLCTTSC